MYVVVPAFNIFSAISVPFFNKLIVISGTLFTSGVTHVFITLTLTDVSCFILFVIVSLSSL